MPLIIKSTKRLNIPCWLRIEGLIRKSNGPVGISIKPMELLRQNHRIFFYFGDIIINNCQLFKGNWLVHMEFKGPIFTGAEEPVPVARALADEKSGAGA